MSYKRDNLNYLKMLKDINKLVENDFSFGVQTKLMPNSEPYTQEEAKQMADMIGKVYTISHGLHCSACGAQYL